jgi:hypothetical protein
MAQVSAISATTMNLAIDSSISQQLTGQPNALKSSPTTNEKSGRPP